ncbi:calcium/calmodulin-regulated receptor-like kinase 1 isoform X3 [Elaeis guineensis]|uniref:calcium/calmodulin-regulated receptor-like kinase 1 isoform X3 n=1 Tax=Elaeis guineensis var. tenera TaxID=51953 RepID=UPI00057B2BC9
MKDVSWGLIIGLTIGVVIGVFLATAALFCIRFQKRRAQIGSSSSRRASAIPICTNGVDTRTELSDSTAGQESPKFAEEAGTSLWLEGPQRKNLVSVSGIPKYCYKDLQKATSNFTTLLGQGAFGTVYRAQMSTGETVAVKVLATNSKQGEKEFQAEVLLLGRLHHRNLVNLVGYCAEKGQHMLIYEYMTHGSLDSHLYSEKHEALSWEWRVTIALDVARGLEYLHDGAVPPVVHRDIKSSNILLDQSMRARAAINAEGKVGWEEIADSRLDGIFDVPELNDVAALAYKCVSRISRKRPSMRDMVEALTHVVKARYSKKHHSKRSLPITVEEESTDQEPSDLRPSLSEHYRGESVDSLSDF